MEPTEEPTRQPTRTPADEPTETPTEEPTRQPTRTPTAVVLFTDDFSDPDSGWNAAEDDSALRAYRAGQYVMEIFKTGWLIWDSPGQGGMSNTHTTVTITNAGESVDPTFGLICNYIDEGAFYFLGFGPDGYYGIGRVEADSTTLLTDPEKNLWQLSDDIEINAARYQVEAVCAADGALTLIVNGVEIASVQDDTYTEGDVGVFAQSFEQLPVEVHFDDLTVVQLD